MNNRELKPKSKAVTWWLWSICFMVIAMVAVGGITRLTGSGLSITEWKPIMGAVPPLNDTEWNTAFEKYKQIPQYKIVNQGMSLGEFKWIFFWEYIHRLLGRSIALVFIIPWIVLSRRGLISRALHKRLVIGFLLFFAQGVMGWIMVVSGLSERTSVSHYRLAAHLALALTALGYMLWVNRAETPVLGSVRAPKSFATLLRALTVLVSVQIVYGAFMAGLKAGHMYSTFPTMNGAWVPDGAFVLVPGWLNMLENPAAIHFVHRTLGWCVLLAVCAFAVTLIKSSVPQQVKAPAKLAIALTAAQFVLGIVTVVTHVSLPIAVAHQVCGALLLSSLLWTVYTNDSVGRSI